MITHEEARNYNNLTSEYDYVSNYWNDYITQQEKKDKLLELYKKERSMLERYINGNYQPMGEHFNIIKQIKQLEGELK